MTERLRAGRTIPIVIALFAIVVASVDGFLITQSGRTTAVAQDDVLAQFRDASNGSGESTTEGDATSAERSDATGGPAAPVDALETATAQSDVTTSDEAPAPAATTAASADPTAPTPTTTSQPAGTPAGERNFRMPAVGVYTYLTSGSETISIAGGRHDYPERTYASVTKRDGCNWRFEHRILEEHVDRRDMCMQGPVNYMTAFRTDISFFGQPDSVELQCDPWEVEADTRDEVGDTHHSVCEGEDTRSEGTSTFLGTAEIVIGGTRIQALRVRTVAEVSGRSRGDASTEWWIHPDTALILKMVRTSHNEADAFGGANVTYEENATFTLESLTPRT